MRKGADHDVVVEAVEAARVLRGVDHADRALDAEPRKILQVGLDDPLEKRRDEQELDPHLLPGLGVGENAVFDLPACVLEELGSFAQIVANIIGSVVGPHPYPDMVARFQSVISEEMRWQLKEKIGRELPNYVMACVGGGSNAAGAFYHFLEEPGVQLVAVEAAGLGINSGMSAATMQLGKPGVLHGSKSLVMQTADGQVIEPHSISAGLDYPGIGPLHAHLFETGRGIFLSATDDEALKAAFHLARTEGIIPALETAHALSALNQLKWKTTDKVVICLSGRGDKDMAAYMKAMDFEG